MHSCPRCRVGQLKEVSLTYYRSFGNNKLLVAPYAPANKCLICRYIEYDQNFLQAIDQMVKPVGQRQPNSVYIQNGFDYQQYFSNQDNVKAI